MLPIQEKIAKEVRTKREKVKKLKRENCKNNDGKLVAPGVYFYKLHIKEYEEANKFIIVR